MHKQLQRLPAHGQTGCSVTGFLQHKQMTNFYKQFTGEKIFVREKRQAQLDMSKFNSSLNFLPFLGSSSALTNSVQNSSKESS